nr:MAG TPA: hypothetical protein [Caudoviricetes sp.]
MALLRCSENEIIRKKSFAFDEKLVQLLAD